MGSIFLAQCSCGYVSEDLPEGYGMAGPESERAVAQCDLCKEVVSIRVNSKRPRCPSCRHTVSVLDTGQAAAGKPSTGQFPRGLECPRCHEFTVHLVEAGLWD